jgi:hypothetical protein
MGLEASVWGLQGKSKLFKKSTVKNIKKRLDKQIQPVIPGVFDGKVYGFIRIPVCGAYGLHLISAITSLCKKKGKEPNSRNMAAAVIRCVIDEDAEFNAFMRGQTK